MRVPATSLDSAQLTACVCMLTCIRVLQAQEAVLEVLDTVAHVFPPPAALPVDTTPPSITLLGDSAVTVPLFTAFTDPGAAAVDDADPDGVTISVFGRATLDGMLFPSTLAALGAQPPGSATYGPFVLSYVASDAAGNSARMSRSVYIDAQCPGGARRCPDPALCETLGLCIPGVAAGGAAAAPPPYEPPVDTTPPELRPNLRPGDVLLPEGGVNYVTAVSTTVAGQVYEDAGAEAIDNTDGDISALVTTFGLKALQAAASVPSADPHRLVYTAQDAAGNVATGVRLVRVVCAPPERDCGPEGSSGCSVAQVCVPQVQPPAAPPPPPVVTLSGPPVVFVEQGNTYRACPQQRPTSMVCDQVCVNCL